MKFETLSILAALLISQAAATDVGTWAQAAEAGTAMPVDYDKMMAVANFAKSHFKEITDNLKDAKFAKELNDHPALVEKMLTVKDSDKAESDKLLAIIKDLNEKSLVHVLDEQNGMCEDLPDAAIVAIVGSTTKAKLINDKCFAVMKNAATAKVVPSTVKNLDDYIFRDHELPMHENFYAGMKPSQVDNYESQSYAGDRCTKGFMMDKLSKEALAAVPRKCFQNWLRDLQSGKSGLTKIPNTHVSVITSDHLEKMPESLAETLVKETFVGTPASGSGTVQLGFLKVDRTVLDKFLTEEGWARHLPETAVPRIVKDELSVSAEAIANMNSVTRSHYIAKAKTLPDNLNDHMSEALWKDLSYPSTKDAERCKAYGCLKYVDSKPNAETIMKPLMDTVCMDLSFHQLGDDEHKLLGKYMTRECYKNLDITENTFKDDLTRVHPNVLQWIAHKRIKTIFSDRNWERMAEDYAHSPTKKTFFKDLFRNPKLCKDGVSKEMIEKMYKDPKMRKALPAISSGCLRNLPFFKDLSVEILEAVGDDAYSAFTKEDAAKLDLAKMTFGQQAKLSADVSDVANHYATTLTAATVTKVSKDAFPAMNEKFFRALPADAYAGLTAEQFAGAPAEKLAHVTAEQAGKLDAAVLKGLSVEQISLLGSAGGPKSDSEKAMLAVLSAASASFSEEQVKAFKTREALSASGAIGLVGASLLAVAASAALLFPLL